jgi:hypothetical protein
MFVAAFRPHRLYCLHRRDSVSGASFVVMVQIQRNEIGIFGGLFNDAFIVETI